MRCNKIKIILDGYHQALLETNHNFNWIENSINYPEIFQEYFGTKNNLPMLKNNPSAEDMIKYKNKNNLVFINENAINLAANKEKYLKEALNQTYQKTSYYASILANLLEEFATNTRVFKSYEIKPMPENDDDTYLPITKFKMICNDGECKAKIVRGGLKIYGNEELENYFDKRILSKLLKTAYTDNLPNEKENRRKLIFMKSVPIENLKSLSLKPAKYKLMYHGNQTVRKDDNEFSITDEPINVLSIRKL